MKKYGAIKRFQTGFPNLAFISEILLTSALLCMLSACYDKGKDIKSPGTKLASSSDKNSIPEITFSNLSKSDSFEISKSGCMFGCPFFTMRINGDGEFKFQDFGGGGAPILTQGKLSEESVKSLFREIEEFGFGEFSATKIKCEQFMSDRTTESMRLIIASKTYSVEYNMGCQGFKGEERLRKFEEKLNSILKLNELSIRKE